jgi:hypothetical protein
VRTFVVRSRIAYGRSPSGAVEELVDLARERGAARYVVPPEGENNSWMLVQLDDLGGLYVRLLEGEAPGGTLLLAVGDGPHLVREFVDGGFEPRVLNVHHGPQLNVAGVIGEVRDPQSGVAAYRDLKYFYGSYAISSRFVRPTRLQFWAEAMRTLRAGAPS